MRTLVKETTVVDDGVKQSVIMFYTMNGWIVVAAAIEDYGVGKNKSKIGCYGDDLTAAIEEFEVLSMLLEGEQYYEFMEVLSYEC